MSTEDTTQQFQGALRYAEQYLPPDLHPAHHARLARIERWIIAPFDEGDTLDSDFEPRNALETLKWTQTQCDYHTQTRHGLAVIRPHQSFPTRCRAWLEHATGVLVVFGIGVTTDLKAADEHMQFLASGTLPALGNRPLWTPEQLIEQTTCADLTSAQAWHAQLLQELDQPEIAEAYVTGIQFTLTICQQVLPQDIDADYKQRLENLKTWISAYLI